MWQNSACDRNIKTCAKISRQNKHFFDAILPLSYEISQQNKQLELVLQIMIRSSFIFKENHVFTKEKGNPSGKVVIVEETLDDVGNLVDLPRLMFINEQCGNLKVVVDRGKLATNSNGNKKSKVWQVCDKCYRSD